MSHEMEVRLAARLVHENDDGTVSIAFAVTEDLNLDKVFGAVSRIANRDLRNRLEIAVDMARIEYDLVQIIR